MHSSVVAVFAVIEHRINIGIEWDYDLCGVIYVGIFSDNTQSLDALNSSPKAYDNKIHVSEIYGNSKELTLRKDMGEFGLIFRW